MLYIYIYIIYIIYIYYIYILYIYIYLIYGHPSHDGNPDHGILLMPLNGLMTILQVLAVAHMEVSWNGDTQNHPCHSIMSVETHGDDWGSPS